MTHRFQYSAGNATAVCAGDWGLLIGVPPTHPLVVRLYEQLVSAPTMDSLTDLLAGSYGEFNDVVVIHAGNPVQTFLWGTTGAESTGGQSVTGGPVGTEHDLSGLVGAWVGPTPVPSAGMLPAGQGVFWAGRLETAAAAAPGPVAAPEPRPVAASPAVTQPELPPAPPVPESPLAHPGFSPAGAPNPVPVFAVSPAPPVPGPYLAVEVPADRTYVPVAPPPVSPGARPGPLDPEYTLRPRTALARRCRAGHLSPAYLDVCPVCGETLDGAPIDVPQPSLGRLVISTGGEVVLDHDAIIGRNPKVPADFPGEPPEVVRVADPDHDVSNRHLQVRVGQWQVVVCDLGSTNGTEVLRPGWPPVALAAGQETTIEPGTRVILAGVVTLTYES